MIILILATNAYIVWRMYQILPCTWLKIAVPGLYVLTLLTYIVSFTTIFRQEMPWAIRLNTALSPILVICLYSLMAFLLMDLGRMLRLIPKNLLQSSVPGSAVLFGTIAALLLIGSVNYRIKHRETVEVVTDKSLEKPLKIVMASDLHLGYNNSRKTLSRWMDLINAEHPDLVLFGGDIIDVSTAPLFGDNFAEEFHRLQSPAYAVFGNHEFISGAEGSMKFYHDAGITILRDSVAKTQGISIIGRDDLYVNHMGTAQRDSSSSDFGRKSLTELTRGISPEEFTILIDHQPYHLEEAELAGIDFQYSGHTHRGQVWPISLLIDFMYEKSWGQHRRGATQYYISSGLGIWGPKIRLGYRSEYLVVTITEGDSVLSTE